MEGNNNEIIDKLKENVISKLDELDSSKKHDSTLIDYILVMVVNQKSKFEMKHNLSLFLGKIVDDFVNWLFEFLADLKMKAIGGNQSSTVNQEKTSTKKSTTEHAHNSEVKNGNGQEVEMMIESKSESRKVAPKRKLKSAIGSLPTSDDIERQENTGSGKKESSKAKKRTLASEDEMYSTKKRSVFDNSDRDSKKKSDRVDDDDDDDKLLDLDDASKENETKFLVTLDGVKDMFKDNDGLFLDEDFDPELMNEDLSNFTNIHKNSPTKNDVSIKENNNGNKVTERCKYWPACMNGQKCEFFHPVTKCNTFPYCRFGDKCLYIHPTCKFDSLCTRKDCPFAHTAKPRGPPMYPQVPMYPQGPVYPQASPIVTCKYFPKCMKPACEFYHPKICHFGAACKAFNCPFVHLPSQNAVPHPSKFKWSSSKKDGDIAMSNQNEIEI